MCETSRISRSHIVLILIYSPCFDDVVRFSYSFSVLIIIVVQDLIRLLPVCVLILRFVGTLCHVKIPRELIA